MTTLEGPAAPSTEAGAASRTRETWFQIVLIGLLVLVVGFTAALVSNGLYPCVPAGESSVQPPIADCAIALSPWIGVALAGLIVAAIGYLRVR